ncbi:serine hydrolase domain-containing protein [Aliidiomarina sp. Khilg15.8]
MSTALQANESLREAAEGMPRMHNVVALHQGELIVDEHIRGPGTSEPANIKSLSKSVLSLLVGIAIDKGHIPSVDAKAVDLLGGYLPADYDAEFDKVTIGNLLSMQSGLKSTSRGDYGNWVNSDNWTHYALTRPMVAEPGGRMIYSTGNSHILAAILTEQTGRSLVQISQEWLGRPLNIRIRPWLQSPEGVNFGGNEMYLSARALVWIGEVYRNKGVVDGVRIVSEGWIEQSLQPQTRSVYTDDPYGYGWFSYRFGETQAYYGRGYGGQVLYVIPQLDMSIAVISDPTPPSRGSYLQEIHRFVERQILPLARDH